MIPIAHGGSGVAFHADNEGGHSSPLSNEQLAVIGPGADDQLVFLQNAEPGGLYCADETDGEALRVCEQVKESLYAYEVGGTDAEPGARRGVRSERRADRVDLHPAGRRDLPRRRRPSTRTTWC